MKTAKVLTNTLLGAPLSALLAFGLTLHANAQTWHNVLVYQLAAGKSAGGNCLAADAAGNVFSGGWGNGTAGYGQGLVLRTDTTEARSPVCF